MCFFLHVCTCACETAYVFLHYVSHTCTCGLVWGIVCVSTDGGACMHRYLCAHMWKHSLRGLSNWKTAPLGCAGIQGCDLDWPKSCGEGARRQVTGGPWARPLLPGAEAWPWPSLSLSYVATSFTLYRPKLRVL